ncbi:AmmeMemoRadiSam system radical SAM enzyme [Candidatus Woesearchaeota archaeon]|nr:AmmeMemoRadiSam system radical SAM enzyme [Candidatus Woesearchaeota archaeon]
MKKAVLFERTEGKEVRCLACCHYCRIKDGNKGICGVRKNINGILYLMVYGKPISIAVDPVEKKPLFHFLPGTKILSFGTVGCNFKCEFCQNWDISQEREDYGSNDMAPDEIVKLAKEKNTGSIAFTYNEPTIFVEYAHDIAKLAKKQGIKSVFVSNGYESKESLEYISKYLDAINIDLKSFNEKFYLKVCKAQLKHVLSTIKLAHKLGIWVEVTTLLIPDMNDSDGDTRQIADFIASVSSTIPWHVTAFHPDYKMEDTHATTKKSLLRAYKTGKKAGLKYVYTGNIDLDGHETTYCPKCGKELIKREFMSVTLNDMKDGKCSKCKTGIEGIWK